MSTQTELAVGTTSEEMQIFDGVMLGDGGLIRYASKALFYMTQSKTSKDGRLTVGDNIAWLAYIKDECLLPLGVEVSDKYPKLGYHHLKGEPRQTTGLSSRLSDLLAEQYDRWYARTGEWAKNSTSWCRRGDTKVLPCDLAISQATLAHWFIGDGGSSRDKRHLSTVLVSLSVCCFTEAEVYRLTTMLNKMGITITKLSLHKNVVEGSGLVIIISQRSVDDFFDLIAPYMPSHTGALQYKRGNGH